MDFQDSPVQSKGTDKAPKAGGASDGKGRNANIMPGGKVDPRSKLYQRSVAGRETIDDAIQRMVSGGSSGRDIFNEIVSGLMSRKYGFVGAYLDSKNPGRTYNQKQAMAITYQKMADNGIDVKDKGKEGGQEQTPGPKAMPVGQQRKQGIKRPTGPALPETKYTKDEKGKLLPKGMRDKVGKRGTGITSPYQQPVAKPEGEGSVLVERRWQENLKSEIAKIKKKEKNGTITPDEAQSLIRELGKKAVQAGKEERERALKGAAAVERRRADQKRDRQDTAAPGRGAKEEEFRPTADATTIREAFKELYKNALSRTGRTLKDHVKRMSGTGAFVTDVQEIIGELENKFNVDPGEFRKAVGSSFGINLDNHPGWDSTIKSGGQEREDDVPSEGGNADLEGIVEGFLDDYATFILDIDSEKRTREGMKKRIRKIAEVYDISPQKVIASIRSDERGNRILERHGFGASSLVRKNKPQPEEEAAPEEQAAPGEQAPPQQAAPAAPKRKPSRRGFGALVPKQSAPRGGGPITPSSKPNPDQIKAVKEKVAKVSEDQLIKEMKQGTLFPSGLVTETSQTNPLEGGSTGVGTPDTEQPVDEKTPEETGDSLLDEEGAAKDFRKSGPEKPKPAAKKPTQRSIRGLGPSAGKFDTTRTQKAGDELLTKDLKSYGFTPKQVKEIQKSGLTEKERQTITQRRQKTQEEKAKQAPKVAEQRGGSLLDGEDQAKDFRKSGPQTPAKPTGGKKTRGPLDQVAKAVMSGIERDKAARESASQFLNRVSKLIRERSGGNVSKSDADQAAASAINQQKGRTTRNKTGKKGVSDNAEYQEFAQSIRAMMR